MAYKLTQKGKQVQDILDAVSPHVAYNGVEPYLKEANATESGLMSTRDKGKVDSIGYMENSDIDAIMDT